MKLRLVWSCAARLEAIVLKAIASLLTSSYPSTGTRTAKSPLEKLWVASAISRRGRTSRSVTK